VISLDGYDGGVISGRIEFLRERNAMMKWFALTGVLSAILAGCSESKPPPPAPPPPVSAPAKAGVEVHAPGVDVNVGKGGVDVNAPGADVEVNRKK
jgi:hypothetical protein